LENLIYSSNVAHNNNIIVPGTDPGVFQGGGGGGGGGGGLVPWGYRINGACLQQNVAI